MINKRQLLLGAGSVLAASTLPAIAHKNADGVALKTIEHPKPFFEVLYVPLDKSSPLRDTPCAVYREMNNNGGHVERAFLGRFNYWFNKDGTNFVDFKLIVQEKVSVAAWRPDDVTREQKENLLKYYKENGVTVAEMPENMLRKHLSKLEQYGPMNAKDIKYWDNWLQHNTEYQRLMMA